VISRKEIAMLDKILEEKNEALYDEFVPVEGRADTKAGELVRAVNRIGYRFWNDGDQIGIDYGNETCNAAARFIMFEFAGTEMDKVVTSLWGLRDEEMYEVGVEKLVREMIDYIESNPDSKVEPNTVDMYEYRKPEDEEWGFEEEYDDWCSENEEYYDEDEDRVFVEPWAVYDPN
jgi:hypothetical protein